MSLRSADIFQLPGLGEVNAVFFGITMIIETVVFENIGIGGPDFVVEGNDRVDERFQSHITVPFLSKEMPTVIFQEKNSRQASRKIQTCSSVTVSPMPAQETDSRSPGRISR